MADEELREWFRARDVFLGLNFTEQDIDKGLRLASGCSHEDAQQLCRTFSHWAVGDIPASAEQAKGVFERTSALSLCFEGFVAGRDEKLLLESAELGYALAQAVVAENSSDENEKFKWATRAAQQDEPMGLYILGRWYERGRDKNLDRARSLLKRSAELGFIESQYAYGLLLPATSPDHFLWLGMAAQNGLVIAAPVFLKGAMKVMEVFLAQNEGAPVVFQIGALLKGHIGPPVLEYTFADAPRAKEAIFGSNVDCVSAERARRGVAMFEEWCDKARLAVNCWTVIAKRLGVPKDIRVVISKLVWQMRTDADYKIVSSDSCSK